MPDATTDPATAIAPVVARRAAERWFALLPLALAALAHLPALWSALVWDDARAADQLAYFRDLADVFRPPAGIPGWSEAYYRPVVVLTYLLDYVWLNGRALHWVPHLSNVLFHVATTGFVWRLARRCLGARPGGEAAALAAAAVFAVHPIHTESVNWISGRSDVLATLLLLPALLLALRWRDQGYRPALAGATALFFLALLAKEVAIVGLVLLPAAWWLASHGAPADAIPARSRLVVSVIAWLAATAGYFLLRQGAGTVFGTMLDLGPVVAAIGLTRVLGYYLVKLVVPWPQCNLVLWEMLPAWTDAALLLLGVAALAAWALRHWRGRGDGLPLLAIAWMLVAIAPSAWIALVYTATGPVAERYLYLPSVGMALGAGALFAAAGAAWGRALAAVVTAVIVVAYLGSALERGIVWTSNLRLWSDATAKMPGRAFQWASLALAWRAEGNSQAAFDAYRKGLELEPDAFARSRVMYGIADLHLERGEFAAAEQEFQRAAREHPEFARPMLGLGLVDMMRARQAQGTAAGDLRAEARRQFESALARDPRLFEAQIALAQVTADEAAALAEAGQRAAAQERWRVAISIADEVLAALPPPRLEAYLRVAEASIERDVPAFRARLAEQLR